MFLGYLRLWWWIQRDATSGTCEPVVEDEDSDDDNDGIDDCDEPPGHDGHDDDDSDDAV